MPKVISEENRMPEQYEEQIVDLLERFRRRGIVLHRPYPPRHPIRTFSKFGGRPNLPISIEWPRCTDPHNKTLTVPLHFLVQISCSELPKEQSHLPKTGGLFFFGRIDEESDWEGIQNPTDDVRVIYIKNLDKSTPARRPPLDTFEVYTNQKPEVDDFILPKNTYLNSYQKRLITNPVDMQVFPEWPMEIAAFDSFPTAYALMSEIPPTIEDHDKYVFMDTYNSLRANRITSSIEAGLAEDGQYKNVEARPINPRETQAKANLPIGKRQRLTPWIYIPDEIAKVLPQLSVFPLEVAAHLGQHIKKTIQVYERKSEPPTEALEALKNNFEEVKYWISRFKNFEPTHLVSETEANKFLTWLSFLASQTYSIKLVVKGEDRILAWPIIEIEQPYWEAISQIVRLCATNAELYAVMPAEFFAYPKHKVQPGNPFIQIDMYYPHQMLSHFPSSQNPFDVHSANIHLLYLYSDYALNFCFWDCGEATFIIAPEDLADKNMERAWASIQG